MTQKLKKELMEYHTFCYRHFKEKLGEFVFCTRQKGKLSDDSIASIFKRMKADINPDYRLSAHSLRHWYAHKLIVAGASNSIVKELLRHENTAMAERYHALWSTDMRDQAEKYNPTSDIEF